MQPPDPGKRDPCRGPHALKDPVLALQLGRSPWARSPWALEDVPPGAHCQPLFQIASWGPGT